MGPKSGLHDLDKAMRDAHGLAVTCWTEGDGALSQLSHGVRCIERGEIDKAAESVRWAMEYMHRWQGRDDAIGNAGCVTEKELAERLMLDGDLVPTSFASAKTDHLDDLVKGSRIVKSVFGHEAKLIISSNVLDTPEFRKAWPRLLDRLLEKPVPYFPVRPISA